jgi:hypothetical protein
MHKYHPYYSYETQIAMCIQIKISIDGAFYTSACGLEVKDSSGTRFSSLA